MFRWLNSIWGIVRKRQLKKHSKAFRDLLLGLNPDIIEDFLKILLKVMSLVFWIDKDYHRNIQGFKGKYLFESKNKKLSVRAIFKHSSLFSYDYLKVSEGTLEDADVTVTFKDAKALMKLLLSPKPDILGALLENEVAVSGNINYIFKFGYMTTQLQKMLLPGVY
jgi:hypothetical protein